MKTLEFLTSWRRWKPGDVVVREDGVANLLLQRKLVKEVAGGAASPAPMESGDLECAAQRTSLSTRRKR